ncbi:sodium:solute symporter family transporter [Aeoliella sp.]|uniref:sodium:solute symporter family transporter n=1 Tax=Aeoliella sp. TaxID=2795800 RepID=UPI003CCC2A5B
MSWLDLAVFFTYIVVLLVIGGVVSYRRRGSEDLFLGGRSMGWANVGFSIFGTNIGPTFLIAVCGAGYTTGMVAANFEWMAWVFLLLLGMVFVPFYMKTGISTMPAFLNKRFGRKCYTFMSFYALFSTVVLWIGGTLFAGGALLEQLLGWDIAICIWLLAVLATSFTIAGGLAAVMVTDSFQSVLMIVGASILSIIALSHVGGFDALRQIEVTKVPAEQTWQLLRPAGDATPWYAFLLGYPVLSLWFWCSDQTIVQRVLGARDLRQGQGGTLFCGFLKILPPFIFLVPGICAAKTLPGIDDDKQVFLLLVNEYLDYGLKGLIVSVLVAAVVSTLNSGLNSFSTIYTLDIHQRWLSRNHSQHHAKLVGRITTLLSGLMAVGIAFYLRHTQESGDLNLFDLFQSIIGYMAPPISAVFVLGIFWRRATAAAALTTLVLGSAICLAVGIANLSDFDSLLSVGEATTPVAQLVIRFCSLHFLTQSFVLFAVLVVLMVAVSLATVHSETETPLPSLAEAYATQHGLGGAGIVGWGMLAVIMVSLYCFFQFVM